MCSGIRNYVALFFHANKRLKDQGYQLPFKRALSLCSLFLLFFDFIQFFFLYCSSSIGSTSLYHFLPLSMLCIVSDFLSFFCAEPNRGMWLPQFNCVCNEHQEHLRKCWKLAMSWVKKFNNLNGKTFSAAIARENRLALCLLLAFLCSHFSLIAHQNANARAPHTPYWVIERNETWNKFRAGFRKSIKQTFGREWLWIDFLMNSLWFFSFVRSDFFGFAMCGTRFEYLTKDSHNF